MANKKQPKLTTNLSKRTISLEAEDWFNQFQKHLRISFLDHCESLPFNETPAEIQTATIRAIVDTLFDSGADLSSFIQSIGERLSQLTEPAIEWNDELNRRRVELIDKDLLGEASFVEQVELAKLTSMMRRYVDTESNLPLKGAMELYRKLLSEEESGEE